jgi:hypothetical protein
MSVEPKTLTYLYELVEKDYAWRISELSNYRSALLTERNEKAKKAKIRAGIALLYAHWEGFIKQLANWYYEFVSFQSNNVSDLNESFASIILRAELNVLESSNKIKDHQRVIKMIFEGMNKTAYFSSKSPIKTSNLKFDIFEDVCILLGINPIEFESRYKRKFDRNIQLTIDEDLVGQRNSIAHGEYLPISIEEYTKLYDIVVNGFLFNFKEIVMDCATNKKYLRNREKATY